MFLGRVIGEVWASRKAEDLEGKRIATEVMLMIHGSVPFSESPGSGQQTGRMP